MTMQSSCVRRSNDRIIISVLRLFGLESVWITRIEADFAFVNSHGDGGISGIDRPRDRDLEIS